MLSFKSNQRTTLLENPKREKANAPFDSFSPRSDPRTPGHIPTNNRTEMQAEIPLHWGVGRGKSINRKRPPNASPSR